MKNLCLLLLFFTINTCFCQYADLYVLDPQRQWNTSPGNIDEVQITIAPKGVYTEMDVYLTFSEGANQFSPGDLLEVVYNFSLPDHSMVIDSWLWIDSIIVKADHIDRWTASEIYEDIVGRRQDPSILFKQSQNDYQLRIFPMAQGTSRKVKMTFLLQNGWFNGNAVTKLPTHLFNPSFEAVPKIDLRVYLEDFWNTPKFLNHSSIQFGPMQTDAIGRFRQATIPEELIYSNLSLEINPLANNGAILTTFPEDKTYQLVFFPSRAFAFEDLNPKKLAILIDYNANNSRNNTINDVLDIIFAQLQNSLSPLDSFNLFISDLNIEPISPNWLPANETSIERLREQINADEVPRYSNLPSLLLSGINYINQDPGTAEILLYSNSQSEGDPTVANSLINDLTSEMVDQQIPIHILDYQDYVTFYVSTNSKRYAGNEYFYTNLSRLTAGSYLSLLNCCPTLNDISTDMFATIKSLRGSFDIHTTLENGFCYERINLLENESFSSTNFNRPIYQLGKYEGTFPFRIEASGIIDGIIVDYDLEIDSIDMIAGDKTTTQVWTGNQIAQRELTRSRTNQEISEIIEMSLSERVLSIFTAFLALEPRLGGEPCTECVDPFNDGTTTSVDDLAQDSSIILKAYPNPFQEMVQIEVKNAHLLDKDQTDISIFSLNGQRVKSFSLGALPPGKDWLLEWNAQSDNGLQLAGGVYQFVIRTPENQQSLKLVYLD